MTTPSPSPKKVTVPVPSISPGGKAPAGAPVAGAAGTPPRKPAAASAAPSSAAAGPAVAAPAGALASGYRPDPREFEPGDDDLLGVTPALRIAWTAVAWIIGAVLIGFSPLTNNLDDIKILLLTVGGGSMLALFAWLYLKGEINLPHKSVMIPYFAFLAFCTLGSTLHALGLVPDAVRLQWPARNMLFFYAGSTGIMLIHSAVIRSRQIAERALFFWVLMLLFQCLFGLFHWGGGFMGLYRLLGYGAIPPNAFANLLYTFGGSPDMLGTILNRQFLGDLLAAWVPLAFVGILIWKDAFRRYISIVAFVLSIPCTYLTFSKATMPGFLISLTVAPLLVFTCTKLRRIRIPHLPWMLAFFAILGATVLFFTVDTYEKRFKKMDVSVDSREVLWKGAIDLWKKHPMIGIGLAGYGNEFPKVRSADYHLQQISNVTTWSHNRLLDLLCENGLIGTALYLWFLGAVFWRGVRVIRESDDDRVKAMAIALMVGGVAFWFTSLFHPGIRWAVCMVPYYAAIGYLVGLSDLKSPPPRMELAQAAAASGKRFIPAWLPDQRIVFRRTAVLAVVVLILLNPLPFSKPFLWSTMGYGVRYLLGSIANNDGLMNMAYNRPDEAVKFFSRAIEWNPTFITSYYKRAHAYNTLEDQERSLETYHKMQEYAPDYSEVHYNLGVIYRLLGDDAQAAALKMPMASDRGNATKQAYDYYKKSLESQRIAARMSNKISVQYSFMSILQRTARVSEDPAERKALLNEAAKVAERIPQLSLTLAVQEEDQLEREREFQDTARKLAPRLYEELEDWAAAAKAWESLYRSDPILTSSLVRAVDNYQRMNDIKAIENLCHWALERNALNFEARDLLARVLAVQPDAESQKESLLQSRILNEIDRKFPGQVPENIRLANKGRLSKLAGPAAVKPDAAKIPGVPAGPKPTRPMGS